MSKKILLAEDTISPEEQVALGEWIKTAARLTKGPLCLEFESVFARKLGVKHAVFVNSGSSANLLVAWTLLESGRLRNRTVIAPAVSWGTTVTPFLQFGFDVKLCDCDGFNLGLDVAHFERLCAEHKPAAAILVHVLGHPCRMDEIMAICRKYGVLLIEDTCEALASTYGEKNCGTMGLAGTFSFYFGHHISTIEGGMVVTDNTEFYNLLLSIRSHGWSRDVDAATHDAWTKEYSVDAVRDLYTFYYAGFNLRAAEPNAFLGLSQIGKIDAYAAVRQRNYQRYVERMPAGHWVQTCEAGFLANFAFGVLAENRQEVHRHLTEHGIECRPLICGNIGRHPFWLKRGGQIDLPMADTVHDYGMYLPNHARLSLEDVDRVCEKYAEVARPAAFPASRA